MFRSYYISIIKQAMRENQAVNPILLYYYVESNFLPDVSIDDFTIEPVFERLTDNQLEALADYAKLIIKNKLK